MKKKGSGAMIIGVMLIIVAMVVGIFIGIMIGRSGSGSDEADQTTNTAQGTIQTETQEETQSETMLETEEETMDDSNAAVVMTVGDSKVSMDEVNVRLYSLRSYYVQSYGEEPWGQTLDDGTTLAEAAKQTLEDDIIRAEIFMDKASEYGISVTDTMQTMCSDEAQNFIDNLGEAVAGEFGLKKEAVEAIYIKYEVITAVTNVINDEIREELLADEANKDLSESELDVKISEAFQKIVDEWKAEYTVDYSDIWENIVVGSVG